MNEIQDRFINGLLNKLENNSKVTDCYCFEDIYQYKFYNVGWYGGVDLIVERISDELVRTKRVLYGVEISATKFCEIVSIQYDENNIANLRLFVQKQAEVFRERLKKELIKRGIYEKI